MGGCGSTQQHQEKKPEEQSRCDKWNPPPPPPMVRVICEDGRVEELSPPVTAGSAISGKGCGAYLCSWESMYVGAWAPEVAPEEYLKPGQVYFVMPKSNANHPLSLHQLCALAIKASSALSLRDFHSSFRR